MKCSIVTSIVISTRNKSEALDSTLFSIRRQTVPFTYEIIVVDDGSTDDTKETCEHYGVRYKHLANPRYRNPSVARNVGYRMAKGKVVIAQSDDVVHMNHDTVELLTAQLQVGEFLFATVEDWIFKDQKPVTYVMDYSSRKIQHPYFFLGSLWRSDIYEFGGNSEDFVEPCYDDNWFADCLIHGLGRKPIYSESIQGFHQHHTHGPNTHRRLHVSKMLYHSKKVEAAKTGIYVGTDAPWPLE